MPDPMCTVPDPSKFSASVSFALDTVTTSLVEGRATTHPSPSGNTETLAQVRVDVLYKRAEIPANISIPEFVVSVTRRKHRIRVNRVSDNAAWRASSVRRGEKLGRGSEPGRGRSPGLPHQPALVNGSRATGDALCQP